MFLHTPPRQPHTCAVFSAGLLLTGYERDYHPCQYGTEKVLCAIDDGFRPQETRLDHEGNSMAEHEEKKLGRKRRNVKYSRERQTNV